MKFSGKYGINGQAFVQGVPPDQNSKSVLRHRAYLPIPDTGGQTNTVSIAILMIINVVPPLRITSIELEVITGLITGSLNFALTFYHRCMGVSLHHARITDKTPITSIVK